MRPSKTEPEGSGDLFRARLDQIINMKHELVRLADAIDWDWIDAELADCFADQGRPGTEVRFMAGLLLLKHIYGLSDEGVCERWVHDPYFQNFTGEAFFQHDLPLRVFLAGQRRGVHGQIKRELRRRSAIEAAIGHMKTDGHLARNYLKGRHGDHANAVLTAVGYNLRLILNWLRTRLRKILEILLIALNSTPVENPAS